jgi:hypothetical protein
MIAEISLPVATVPLSRSLRTAVLLLGDQAALGGAMLQELGRHFASVFPQVLFHSVAIIDYDVLDSRLKNYEIGREIDRLRSEAQSVLDRLVLRSRGMGMAADRCVSVGTDPVAESATFCAATAGSHPLATFFLGKLVYPREKWHHWLFRDRTASALQARLEKWGIPVVVLPVLAPGP